MAPGSARLALRSSSLGSSHLLPSSPLTLFLSPQRPSSPPSFPSSPLQHAASASASPWSREALEDSLRRREASHRSAASAVSAASAGRIVLPPQQAITCSTLAQDVIEGRVPHDAIGGHKHSAVPLVFGPVSMTAGVKGGVRGGLVDPLAARDLARARVFQPSHSLPGMSIEDAGLAEMKMMQDWKDQTRREMEEQGFVVKERDDGMGGKPSAGDGDDDDEVEEEEDVDKARQWDDWKDDHRRGWGNSKLTPCG